MAGNVSSQESDIYWDKTVSINYIGKKQTYDPAEYMAYINLGSINMVASDISVEANAEFIQGVRDLGLKMELV